MLGRRLQSLLVLLTTISCYGYPISTFSQPLHDRRTTRSSSERRQISSKNAPTSTTTIKSIPAIMSSESAVTTVSIVKLINNSSGVAGDTNQMPVPMQPKKKLYSAISMEERIARDDWRAPIDHPVIIWSRESKWHPNFRKDDDGVGGEHDKVSVTSRYMSFAILGSVVAFVLYAYLSHIMYAKKVKRREARVIKLSNLMVRSGYDASSLNLPQIVVQDEFGVNDIDPLDSGERRRSILNLFKGFRL